MGSKGTRVQSVTSDFDVKIKFPEKNLNSGEVEAEHVNGQSADGVSFSVDDTPKPCDIILITGKN